MFLVDIGIFDIILSTIYALFIILIAYAFRPKDKMKYNRFFMPFIYFKLLAAVSFALLHIYIYQGGDTFVYFAGGNYFAEQIFKSPLKGLNLLFSNNDVLDTFPYSSSFNIYYFFGAKDVFFMSKLTCLFSLLSFKQYLATTILFSLISSVGIWKMYQTFCKLYPSIYKYFAVGVLFYPSLAIWGSGVLKDPITLSTVGLMFFAFYNLFQRRKFLRSGLYIAVGTYLCLMLKPYILYTFIPSMLLWGQASISQNIKNQFFRYFITPSIILLFAIGGYYFLRTISDSAGKYSLENVQEVAEGFHSWHTHLAENRNQSGYSLGTIEFTPLGLLQKLPEALFVTYYRPFIFGDIRNFATAFEGIQSFILLLITIYIIFRAGLFTIFRLIFFNPNVRAFFIFAVTLGAAVGLTSYNFGALSRYKIPCLPFFTASLAIFYYHGVMVKKRLEQPQKKQGTKMNPRFVN